MTDLSRTVSCAAPAVALAASVLLLFASPAAAQIRVDHSAWQTPIRNQGSRNTCTVFGALAGLEARYKRQGYGDIDLSEQFANAMLKSLWLHPYWNEITTVDTAEAQAAWSGGGGGSGHADSLATWFKVPLESAWPYVSNTPSNLPAPWGNPYWNAQSNLNAWNLDPANLPRSVLKQPVYYSATGVVYLTATGSGPARDPAVIESALRAGYEVIWDTSDVVFGQSTWRPANATPGGHSMLIVGYDRAAANPADHYFIVKNSWGETGNPGGYTHVTYDFLRAFGSAASYLTGAATPSPWPELRMLGRRNICFNGHRGTLDIYHIPGTASRIWSWAYGVTRTDRRLGMFTDQNGNKWKVNGTIAGNTIVFWWKGGTPNLPYDETATSPTSDRQFTYTIVDDDGDELAGWHTDTIAAGPPFYGGYLRRPTTMTANDGFLTPVFSNGTPVSPDQWLGNYQVRCADQDFVLDIQARNDLLLPAAERSTHAGFACNATSDGVNWTSLVGRVPLSQPYTAQMTVPFLTPITLDLRMLGLQRGVFGGRAALGGGVLLLDGAYGVRTGGRVIGSRSYYGTRCGPTGRAPYIYVDVSQPTVGTPVPFRAQPMAPSSAAFLAVGLSRTSSGAIPLPYSLAPHGAPGCSVQADPLVTMLAVSDGAGVVTRSMVFGAPALVGQAVYAQWICLDPTANALGMTTSDGASMVLGGVR